MYVHDCLCLCICGCIHVYELVLVCMYMNARVYMSTFVCVWLCVYIRVCMCVWLYVSMNVYLYLWVWRKILLSSPVPEVQRCLIASASGTPCSPATVRARVGSACLTFNLHSPCAWQRLARGSGWRNPQGSRWPTVWSLPRCMHSRSPAGAGSRSARSHRCGTCGVDRGVSLRNSRPLVCKHLAQPWPSGREECHPYRMKGWWARENNSIEFTFF